MEATKTARIRALNDQLRNNLSGGIAVTKEGWTDFLQVHPSGFFANQARGQLAKLKQAEGNASGSATGRASKAS